MEELRLRKSARKDSMRIEKLVYDYYYTLVPPLDGFSIEEEMVCKKIVDKDGKIIVEKVYDWNVEFFKKNGYKIAGEIPDLPKGHSFYILEKFF